MYFTVYILLIEFAVELPVGKYKNVPQCNYSSFFVPIKLPVRTEVGQIINTNAQHHKDSNKHKNKQIFHLKKSLNALELASDSNINTLLTYEGIYRLTNRDITLNIQTISLIIISVGPMVLSTRNTFKHRKYMKIKEKPNMRLALFNVSSLDSSRTAIPAIRNMYDNISATFQKFRKNLFVRENGLRQERCCVSKPP